MLLIDSAFYRATLSWSARRNVVALFENSKGAVSVSFFKSMARTTCRGKCLCDIHSALRLLFVTPERPEFTVYG